MLSDSLITPMNTSLSALRSLILMALFASFSLPARAEQQDVDLTTTPLIYKSPTVIASAHTSGQGQRLEYQFESKADSLYFRFPLKDVNGPIKSMTISAKGTPNIAFVSLRDSDAKAFSYTLGPLSESEQSFTINLNEKQAFRVQNEHIQYPIKFIDFLFKMKDGVTEGSMEVSKVTFEIGE